MTVAELLPRLECVWTVRNGWTARCPAHRDRNPSMSIREGRDGRVLLKCFAGCTVEAICGALQIRVSELFASPSEKREPVPRMVREAQRELIATGLRSRLTRSERERPVTVVLADRTNPDPAIARALELAVGGELVQVVLE
jgi:hypothetical protein